MPYWTSYPYGQCGGYNEFELMTVEQDDDASIKTMVGLRDGLKVIASIGGWNFPSAYFSKMVATAESRAKFITSAQIFLKKYGFVGIDLDWEFPCSAPRIDPVKITCDKMRTVEDAGGNCPADTINFVTFLKELREGLGDSYYISVASQASEQHWQQMDIKNASAYIDHWHVMSYDYAVPDIPSGAPMSPNAPLYTPSSPNAVQMSINYTIQGYLSAGVPASKIMLGIPFYGHTWYKPGMTNKSTAPNAWTEFGNNGTIQGACCGPFQNTYGGKPGQHCQQCGVYMYSEVLNALGGSEAGSYHDPQTVSDIAYMAGPGQDGGYTEEGTWISFSGTKSIQKIIDYANSLKLAGAFIWDTSMDSISPAYALTNQIADALGKPK